VREDLDNGDAADLPKAIKTKVMSEQAFCKLFCAVLSGANVNYQIVLGGDRSDYGIDKNLEIWGNARHFLFYFPSLKKFMAPTAVAFRYPWVPPTWTETPGLYCVITTLGGYQSALAEIKNIPMEAAEHSYHNMDIKASLDPTADTMTLDVKQSYGGYTGQNYKAPFIFYAPDEQQKLLKELIKFGTNSENIVAHSLENKEADIADPYQPFVIKAKVKSTQLMERAGNKIIIKIGDFIGQQVQMYDTRERMTSIDVTYPHSLVRTIELAIPDGYEIKNLKDLNFSEVVKDGNDLTMGFTSSYELKGNILKIVIDEEYKRYSYALTQYPSFKKIINAAADFNKVALVLDKK
jgi:hypothetical protein